MTARLAAAAGALALALTGACGGDGSSTTSDAPTTTSAATTTTEARVELVAWERLRNPIYADDWMSKDQAVVWDGERWHLWCSSRRPGRPLAYATSPDLSAWTEQTVTPAVGGSPDVTQRPDGTWVMTVQVDPPAPADPDVDDLAYRIADAPEDLATAPIRPLAPGFYDDTRRIDAAIASTAMGTYLFFKRGGRDEIPQHVVVLHSPTGSLDGPWDEVGEPNLGWFENYQLLEIDGLWHVLGTRIPLHVPELWRLDGDPTQPASWLTWTKVRDLDIPEEAWNSGGTAPGIDYEFANSAYLVDARDLDGFFYAFYAGSTELTQFDGRGHAKIGVARSRDLATWSAPRN